MTRATLRPSVLVEAPCLPSLYEEALLEVMSVQMHANDALFEQMLSHGLHVELFVEGQTRQVSVIFDALSGRLMIRDPKAPEGQWKWRRLRRLVLRDILLRNLSKTGRDLRDIYPHLSAALRFPRPDTLESDAGLSKELSTLIDARLTRSERVTFDRRLFPLAETLETGELDQLRRDVRSALFQLTEDQIVALIQDDITFSGTPICNATVFPISEYVDIVTLTKEANESSDTTISLSVPSQAHLMVEIGAGMQAEEKLFDIALLFSGISPSDVMTVLRESPLTQPSTEVLNANGLSLDELVIRESRFDKQ